MIESLTAQDTEDPVASKRDTWSLRFPVCKDQARHPAPGQPATRWGAA